MPQMSPMSWILISLMTMATIKIAYPSTLNKKSKPMGNTHKNLMKTFSWKW